MSVSTIVNSVKHVLSAALAITTIPDTWIQVVENKENDYTLTLVLPFVQAKIHLLWQQAILQDLSKNNSLKIKSLEWKWQDGLN